MIAYPLQWPNGWKRATYRKPSRFKITASFGKVRDELFKELKLLGAKDVVLSTNIPLKLDGLPYAKFAAISDVGVAVYFNYKNRPMVFACDAWKTIEENLHSITKTIDAIRGIERWGASEMLERAFTGFAQLEAPKKDSWWEVLCVEKHWNLDTIKYHYREWVKIYHESGVNPNPGMMSKINHAWDEAQKEKR